MSLHVPVASRPEFTFADDETKQTRTLGGRWVGEQRKGQKQQLGRRGRWTGSARPDHLMQSNKVRKDWQETEGHV